MSDRKAPLRERAHVCVCVFLYIYVHFDLFQVDISVSKVVDSGFIILHEISCLFS